MANEIKDLKGFRKATHDEYQDYCNRTKRVLFSHSDLVAARLDKIMFDEINEADYIKQWSEHDTD